MILRLQRSFRSTQRHFASSERICARRNRCRGSEKKSREFFSRVTRIMPGTENVNFSSQLAIILTASPSGYKRDMGTMRTKCPHKLRLGSPTRRGRGGENSAKGGAFAGLQKSMLASRRVVHVARNVMFSRTRESVRAHVFEKRLAGCSGPHARIDL